MSSLASAWNTVTLDTPIPVSTAKRYKAAYSSDGRYSNTANYWISGPGANGHTAGILVMPNNAGVTGAPAQSSYAIGAGNPYPGSGYVSGNFQEGNYWIDVTVTDVEPPGAYVPPTASAIPAMHGR